MRLGATQILRIRGKEKMKRKGSGFWYMLTTLILVCAMSQAAAAEEPITICATLPVTGPPSYSGNDGLTRQWP